MVESPTGHQMQRILVTGGGGLIGSHLAEFLHLQGNFVRVVDTKFDGFPQGEYYDEKLRLDLRDRENCIEATEEIDQVYNLAANMGGIGFITDVAAEIMYDNTLINTYMLEASRRNRVGRYLFSSSACVYPSYRQTKPDIVGLKEEDAYPADPDTFYGWEKLYSEKMCDAYSRDHGMDTRIARYHNVYGPGGTYKGGREKSIAAICRKVAEAQDPGAITIWGDGKQTRSYCYIDDAVKATSMLMESDYDKPLNIGSDRLISVNEVCELIIRESGKTITREYDLSAPQGVRGRNADLTLATKILGWRPHISLEEGVGRTYTWIMSQLEKNTENIIRLQQSRVKVGDD